MKYRGGNYNIGISVYFQAMFIEYKGIYKRYVAWRNFKKIHEEIVLWSKAASYILRTCLFVRRDETLRKFYHIILNSSGTK